MSRPVRPHQGLPASSMGRTGSSSRAVAATGRSGAIRRCRSRSPPRSWIHRTPATIGRGGSGLPCRGHSRLWTSSSTRSATGLPGLGAHALCIASRPASGSMPRDALSPIRRGPPARVALGSAKRFSMIRSRGLRSWAWDVLPWLERKGGDLPSAPACEETFCHVLAGVCQILELIARQPCARERPRRDEAFCCKAGRSRRLSGVAAMSIVPDAKRSRDADAHPSWRNSGWLKRNPVVWWSLFFARPARRGRNRIVAPGGIEPVQS